VGRRQLCAGILDRRDGRRDLHRLSLSLFAMKITIRRDGGLSRNLTRRYRAADRLPPRDNYKAKLAVNGRRFAFGHYPPVGTGGHRVGYPVNRKDGNWRGLHW